MVVARKNHAESLATIAAPQQVLVAFYELAGRHAELPVRVDVGGPISVRKKCVTKLELMAS